MSATLAQRRAARESRSRPWAVKTAKPVARAVEPVVVPVAQVATSCTRIPAPRAQVYAAVRKYTPGAPVVRVSEPLPLVAAQRPGSMGDGADIEASGVAGLVESGDAVSESAEINHDRAIPATEAKRVV